MTIEQRVEDSTDQFPVGMRVLAVDDDPICLLLLKNLLRKCKYHVTAVSHAIMALKQLRENKDNYDLVISDVHMPDMDGFKLLELVGLEMDLPVIMLSANSDPKLVMKGISHGACDYLLKPVRIEELQIIWQHVIRRKKFDPRDHNNSDKPQAENDEGGQGLTGMGKPDQNGKLNKKRKDQNGDDDEEHDDDDLDNDDPSMQKKPRVVWSVELHRKFVAAVNQLGLDKAVPKRILELMNVEKLTRENVASHLQKYRLYLKRISCVESQQANMAAAFGSTDSSYFRGSMNGIANFSTFSGTAQFQNAAMRSFPYNGMLGRLNSPAGLGVRGLSSSGVVPLGRAAIPGYLGNHEGKFQPVLLPGKQNGSILQGMPTSFEFDELKDNKGVTSIREFSNKFDDLAVFPVSCGFPDAKGGNSSTTSLPAVPSNSLILQGHPAMRSRGGVGSQSSVIMASLSLDVPSYMQDQVRCNDKWPNSIQSSGIQPTSYSFSDSYGPVSYSCSSRGSVSTLVQQTGSQLDDVSPVSSLPIHLQDSVTDLQCQAVVTASNGALNTNCAREQAWDDPGTDDLAHVSNLICNPMSSSIAPNGVATQLGQTFDSSKVNPGNMDFSWIQQSNFADSLPMQHSGVPKMASEMRSMPNQGPLMGHAKPLHIQGYSNFGSLEDLVSSMMKQEHDDPKDFGRDSFSL